jgi:non-ribosomal peptide synthetase component E (peptide arylation enzyme)
VTGRKKNVIIRAGLKIQAEEIEQLLSSHPKIRQSVIVAVPDERLGERAALFVVPHPGQSPTLDEVLEFLAARGVAKFKWPEFLNLIDALPVNAVGKLDRIRLRDAVRQV